MIDQEKYVKVIANPLEKQQSVAEVVNNVDAEFTENGTYSAPAPYTGYGTVVVSVQPNTQDITITSNGTYSASQPYTGFGTVTVNVPEPTGSYNINANGTYNVKNYATAVVNVPNGTETKSITENGTYTPSGSNIGFSSVTVNVPNRTSTLQLNVNGTYIPPTGYIGFSKVIVSVPDKTFLGLNLDLIAGTVSDGVVTRPANSTPDFTGITSVGGYALQYLFYNRSSTIGDIVCPNLTEINVYGMQYAFASTGVSSFSANNITSITGGYACYYMLNYTSSLTTFSMNSLTTVSGASALAECLRSSGVQTVNLPNLEYLTNSYAMQGFCRSCSSLTTINMPKLKSITGTNAMSYAFYGTRITTYTFEALEEVNASTVFYRTFGNNSYLQSLYFPKLKSTSFGNKTDQFNGMLYGDSGVTVHFPSNLQSVIGSWADVQAGFGGTNTTVLFDLTATE